VTSRKPERMQPRRGGFVGLLRVHRTYRKEVPQFHKLDHESMFELRARCSQLAHIEWEHRVLTPPPLSLHVATAGKNHLSKEITTLRLLPRRAILPNHI
jgi:hypothetical protein